MIRFNIHVTPGASRAGVLGTFDDALRVRVTARAVEGGANQEVLESLARAFGVRASAVRIVRGHHSRLKVVLIEGDDVILEARRGELMIQAPSTARVRE